MAASAKKKRKTNVNNIVDAFMKHESSQDRSVSKSTGLWGLMCSEIDWDNTRENRTYLKKICTDEKEEVNKQIKAKHRPKKKVYHLRENPIKKRYSAYEMRPEKKAFCLCRTIAQKEGASLMIECESCCEWYHSLCIGLEEDTLKDVDDSEIKFICGLLKCRSTPTLILGTENFTGNLLMLKNDQYSVPREKLEMPHVDLSGASSSELKEEETGENVFTHTESTELVDNLSYDKSPPPMESEEDGDRFSFTASLSESNMKNVPSSLSQNSSSDSDRFSSDSVPNVSTIVQEEENTALSEESFGKTKHESPAYSEDYRPSSEESSLISDTQYSAPETFSFEINNDIWSSLLPDNGYRLTGKWTEVFRQEFKTYNKYCIPIFKMNCLKRGTRKTKSPYFHARAKCKFHNCATYTFQIPEKPSHGRSVIVTVHRIGDFMHDKNEKQKFPLKQPAREHVAKELSQKGPSSYFYDKLGKMDKDVLSAGNITECQTPTVLRKALSESRKAEDLHREILIDLQVTQSVLSDEDETSTKVKGYIQSISIKPFWVHLFKEEQIKLFVKCRKRLRPTLHLDATGNVCSKIHNLPDSDKRILYYALILPGDKKEPPVPVTELISNSHNVPTICTWLQVFLHAVKSSYYSQNLSGVTMVVDFSWAEILACLQAFNTMSLKEYLHKCSAVISGKFSERSIRELSFVYLCAAHMIKHVRTTLSKWNIDKGLSEFFTFCFARLQMCHTLQQQEIIYTSMCTVFCTESNTEDVRNSLQHLNVCIADVDLEEEMDDIDLQIEVDEKFGKTLRDVSPFTSIFDKILAEVKDKTSCTESSTINEYYMCEAFQVFHNRYMHLIPLFSGILLQPERYASDSQSQTQTAQPNRLSNSHVENWFKIVKTDILSGKKRLPVGKFVRKMHVTLKGRLRNIKYKVHPKVSKKTEIPIDLSEEVWRPRQQQPEKPTSKYYDMPKEIPKPNRKKAKTEKPLKVPFNKKIKRKESKKLPAMNMQFKLNRGIQNLENNCWLNSTLQAFTTIHVSEGNQHDIYRLIDFIWFYHFKCPLSNKHSILFYIVVFINFRRSR